MEKGTISWHNDFEAGHRLMYHEGKCKNMHGHRYEIEVKLKGTIDVKTGMVVDFNVLKGVIKDFDHCFFWNKDDPLLELLLASKLPQNFAILDGEPTVENIANEIYYEISKRLPKEVYIIVLKLKETKNSQFIIRGDRFGQQN